MKLSLIVRATDKTLREVNKEQNTPATQLIENVIITSNLLYNLFKTLQTLVLRRGTGLAYTSLRTSTSQFSE